MESIKASQKHEWYTFVHGERVIVSEEVYKTICSHNNHYRFKMRCEQRCLQTNYACCEGDCQRCRYHVTGKINGLDTVTAGKTWFMDSGIDIEADFILKETMLMAFQIAESSVTDGAEILRMYIEEGLTYREIAAIMGIHCSTVGWRINRILNVLRESYDEVFQ